MNFILKNLLFAAAVVNAQYAAPLLGNVGVTSVAGVEDDGDFGRQNLPVGTSIYGPFEAGFTSMQDFVLAKLGCQTGRGYIQGGVDTWTAEAVVARDCGVELPRWEGNDYISILGTCGGHTGNYHFHERFTCLYEQTGGHSTEVGVASDGKKIYGKWENFETQELPLLDACGGHWGPTPDCEWCYHYHVQDTAPFTIGCFGPNPDNSLVTVEQCRSLYPGCGDGDQTTLLTKYGAVDYDPWCPCYDADGSTIGTKPLPVFSYPEIAQGPGGQSVSQQPSTGLFGGVSAGGSGSKMSDNAVADTRKFDGVMGGSQTSTGKFGGIAAAATQVGATGKAGNSQQMGTKGTSMFSGARVMGSTQNQNKKVGPISSTEPACAGTDKAPAAMCSTYSDHCQNGQRYHAWMQEHCANTCCQLK